jgi:hypothetical protein
LLLDRLCKRFQYQRVEGTEWIEQEVCPWGSRQDGSRIWGRSLNYIPLLPRSE